MSTLIHSRDFWMLVCILFGPALCVCSVTAWMEAGLPRWACRRNGGHRFTGYRVSCERCPARRRGGV